MNVSFGTMHDILTLILWSIGIAVTLSVSFTAIAMSMAVSTEDGGWLRGTTLREEMERASKGFWFLSLPTSLVACTTWFTSTFEMAIIAAIATFTLCIFCFGSWEEARQKYGSPQAYGEYKTEQQLYRL